jgi:hypothetical protein
VTSGGVAAHATPRALGAAGPWQEGFFAMLADLARAGNQVITVAGGLTAGPGGVGGWPASAACSPG